MKPWLLFVLLLLYGCSSSSSTKPAAVTPTTQATAIKALSLSLVINNQSFAGGVLTYRNDFTKLSGLVRMADSSTNARVDFLTSNSAVATVDSNGYLIAKQTGFVTVTARAHDDPSQSLTFTVNVLAPTGADTLASIQQAVSGTVTVQQPTGSGGNAVSSSSNTTTSSGPSFSAPAPTPMPTPYRRY